MLIYLIIIFAIIARFIPHMPNVAPITALAIFGAAYLPKKQAIVIPLAARFVSDIFLGFFSWPLMVAVYAAHLVGVLFGLWIRKSDHTTPSRQDGTPLLYEEGDTAALQPMQYSATRIEPVQSALWEGIPSALSDEALAKSEAGGSGMNRWLKIITSSLGASVVFFLVTNFAFLYGTGYAHNLSGVILAYTNGLPFFRGTLFGDLGYTAALFGSYEFARYLVRKKSLSLVGNS